MGKPNSKESSERVVAVVIESGMWRIELGIYTKAAVASGVTIDEITEALIQITVYCGTPAGRQAFLAAHEALKSESGS